ncbi:DegV family EDD domain-containing protein, partial [bacterium]|nr:DegV family EDD domain-containing protein [bacterium]
KESSIARVSEEIAESGLLDARGNSGSILVEIFYGLAQGFEGLERVTTRQFAEASQIASNRAASAVAEPREGTILTVLREWSFHLAARAADEPDFTRLLAGSMEPARQALQRTTSQLDVLGESGVVDAGAQGFLFFLEGVLDLMETGTADEELPLEDLRTEVGGHGPMAEADSKYRYCTECLISGSNLDKAGIRHDVESLADSVIVAGSSRQVRLHLHTDEPGRVFETLSKRGEIQRQKVEDMSRQQEASRRSSTQSIVIATDSGCDLPEEYFDELNIHLIPHRISFGNKSYIAKVTLSSTDFYHLLDREKDHPQTSQPTPGDYIRTFEYLSSHFQTLVAILMSGKLSGTFQSGKQFAARVSERIHAYDARTCSVGQGIIVLEAARDAKANKPLAEIMKGIERRTRNMKSFVCVETLKYLIRGGRLGRLKGLLGQMLGMKPIFQFDAEGGLQMAGRVLRGWNVHDGAIDKVSELASSMKKPRVAIAHADCLNLAHKYADAFAKRFSPIDTMITPLSPVMGVHGGRNCIGVALLDEAAE